jgi:Anti-sigma regulatory factor (Ser/Thr protein kinase)
MEKGIRIKNQISELEKIAQFIEGICEELGLDMEMQMNLNLVIEEMVTNVIFYAYPKDVEAEIELLVKSDNDDKQLTFVLSDHGKPFDPTTRETTDLSVNPAERDLGGMGIFIVKNIMDEVTYQRLEDNNLLTMTKNIK